MKSDWICDYCENRDIYPECAVDCDVDYVDKDKINEDLNSMFDGIEVAPVIYAHWITTGYSTEICSACSGKRYVDYENWDEVKNWKFCPHCGAKMTESSENSK